VPSITDVSAVTTCSLPTALSTIGDTSITTSGPVGKNRSRGRIWDEVVVWLSDYGAALIHAPVAVSF
jgi:hypothetical protein